MVASAFVCAGSLRGAGLRHGKHLLYVSEVSSFLVLFRCVSPRGAKCESSKIFFQITPTVGHMENTPGRLVPLGKSQRPPGRLYQHYFIKK